MAQPLELSYNWRTPVTVATIGVIACLGLLSRGRPVGWFSAAAVLVGCWCLLVGVVWLRTRAYLEIDGSVLITRRFGSFHRIEGSQVVAVREFLTASGPCHTLVWRAPDGAEHRQAVPTALLRRGHSTLFTWILTWAPAAELDRRARRTLGQLQVRGLVE